MILHLRQWNLVAQYPLSLILKSKYLLYIESFGSWRQNSAFRRQVPICFCTSYKSCLMMTCSNSFWSIIHHIFYCGGNIFFTLNLSVPGRYYMIIGAHDSMIIIKKRRKCHIWRYSCNTLARSPAPCGKIK